jgi:hypothetical protein
VRTDAVAVKPLALLLPADLLSEAALGAWPFAGGLTKGVTSAGIG